MPLAYGLVDPVDLSLPRLPERCHGLRIAHLSDLHITERTRNHSRLVRQLSRLRIDLIAFTGDLMYKHDPPEAALETMAELSAALRPRLGMFGVFGNHDTADFRQAARKLPVTWLDGRAVRLQDVPIDLLGVSGGHLGVRPDSVALALDMHRRRIGRPDAGRLRLMLAHFPTTLPIAADLGVDFALAGHSHGGQWRLPTGHALNNSSDLPLGLTAGLFRHRDTIMAVSRGLGEGSAPWRMFCPHHAPVYTLRRGPVPEAPGGRIVCYRKW